MGDIEIPSNDLCVASGDTRLTAHASDRNDSYQPAVIRFSTLVRKKMQSDSKLRKAFKREWGGHPRPQDTRLTRKAKNEVTRSTSNEDIEMLARLYYDGKGGDVPEKIEQQIKTVVGEDKVATWREEFRRTQERDIPVMRPASALRREKEERLAAAEASLDVADGANKCESMDESLVVPGAMGHPEAPGAPEQCQEHTARREWNLVFDKMDNIVKEIRTLETDAIRMGRARITAILRSTHTASGPLKPRQALHIHNPDDPHGFVPHLIKLPPYLPHRNRQDQADGKTMVKPLLLDGRHLEGGGQLVRVALALSALCKIPIRIRDIRGNRAGKKQAGGLKESHLAAVRALQQWSGAYVEGDEVGSIELLFVPEPKWRGLVDLDDEVSRIIELKNPGSVWLVLQAILPFVLFSGMLRPMKKGSDSATGKRLVSPEDSDAVKKRVLQLTLKGGTNVSKSMSGEYVQLVLLPMLKKIGLPEIHAQVVKRGWAGYQSVIGEVKLVFPIGSSTATWDGKVLERFRVEGRGLLNRIGLSIVAGSPKIFWPLHDLLQERIREAFPAEMFEKLDQRIEIDIQDMNTGDDRRLYVLLVAYTETGWRLGRDYLWGGKVCKDSKATAKMIKEVGEAVVGQLSREWARGGCVDEFMQDQLVVFQALAKGRSVVNAGRGRASGTLHAQTVRWVCEEMLGKAGLSFDRDGGCEGAGWGVGGANVPVEDTREGLEKLAPEEG